MGDACALAWPACAHGCSYVRAFARFMLIICLYVRLLFIVNCSSTSLYFMYVIVCLHTVQNVALNCVTTRRIRESCSFLTYRNVDAGFPRMLT